MELNFSGLSDALEDYDNKKITFSNFSSASLDRVDISNVTVPHCLRDLSQCTSGRRLQAKLMVDVLTAIITEKGITPIPTAYFALLISSIPNNIQEDELVLFLLGKIITEMPQSVLISRFNETITTLLSCIQHSYDHIAIVKAVLKCIEKIMKSVASQITTKKWSLKPQLIVLFQTLISLGVDNRAKVSQLATECINAFFSHDNSKTTGKQSGKIFLKFFTNQFNNTSTNENDAKTLSRLVSMTSTMITHFSASTITEIINFLLTQLKERGNSNASLKHNTFILIRDIFSHSPCIVPTQLIPTILSEVEQLKPRSQDSDLVSSYSQMISHILIALHEVDANSSYPHISPAIKTIMSYVPVGKEEIFEALFVSIEKIMTNCIDDTMKAEAISNPNSNSLSLVISHLYEGLGYQYQHAWGYVLILFAALFKKLDNRFTTFVKAPLRAIEEYVKDLHSSFNKAGVLALTSAIQSLSPISVLEVLPFNFHLPLQSDERREWLLPLLQQSISHSEIAFFGKYFLPLAKNVKSKSEEEQQKEEFVRAKHLLRLYHQIWSLLTAIFSTFPSDVKENFKNIAKILADNLNEDEDLRVCICTSLQALIDKNRDVIDDFSLQDEKKGITADIAKENIQAIAVFSKNFLPIFFNLYCTLPDTVQYIPTRTQLLKTIESFVIITSDQVLNTFFSTVLKKLTSEQDTSSRSFLYDIAYAFVSRLDNQNLVLLYDIVKPNLQSDDSNLQKKSWKIIEKYCRLCSAFVSARLDEFDSLLTHRLIHSKPSTRTIRFKALRSIIPYLSESRVKELIGSAFLGEVILNVKISSSTREESLGLLVLLGKAIIPADENATPFLQLASAGLAGTTPQMISATIESLSRLLKVFSGRIDNSYLEILLKSTTVLFASKQRELQKSCLGFFKIAVSTIDVEVMRPFVPSVVSSVLDMAEHSKNRLRMKIVIERLIKRFGYETIHELVPDKFKKMVSNIQKALKKPNQQTQKKKVVSNDNLFSDDEDDEDEEMTDVHSHKQHKQTKGASLQLRDDDIVDLMDPANAKSGLSKKRKQREDEFKLNEDGKWVFDDDSTKKRKVDSDDEEAEDSDDKEEKNKKPVHIIRRKIKQKQQSGYTGKEFKGKSGGDVKRAGKFEPFAYHPLNPNLLNKRKKSKAASEFKNLVKSAHKGAGAAKMNKKHK